MKAVLMSIKPKWCEKIARGEKTVEVRKTRPKLETPFKCYIYCTKDELLTKSHCDGSLYISYNKKFKSALERAGNITFSGKVVGEFVCDMVDEYKYSTIDGVEIDDDTLIETALGWEEINIYAKGKTLYGWHISDLKIYDEPKGLGEFLSPSGSDGVWGNHYLYRAPQSWCYVEEL